MKNHLHPDEKVRRHPALYVTLSSKAAHVRRARERRVIARVVLDDITTYQGMLLSKPGWAVES